MKTYGGNQVEAYFKKLNYEEIKNVIGAEQFEFLVFDDDEACVLYNLCVYHAAVKAGFEVVSTIPKEDYIEVICPICNQIYIYKFEDIDGFHCQKCIEEDTLEQLEKIIMHNNYKIISVDKYTGEVCYECPDCGHISVATINDTVDSLCKMCLLMEKAEMHGFTVRSTVPEEYEDISDADGVFLECNTCDSYIRINLDKLDVSKDLENLICPYCELEEISQEKGLRQEDDSGSLNIIEKRGIGWYPFVCNECGSIQYMYINPIIPLEALEDKLKEIRLFDCKERKSGNCEMPDVIKHTAENNVVWFADVYNLFTAIPLTYLNSQDLGELGQFDFPYENIYSSYIGVDLVSNKNYLFVEFDSERYLDPWSSRYLFATFDESAVIIGNNLLLAGEILWPMAYYKLRDLIQEQILSNEMAGASRKLFYAYEKYIDLIFHMQRDAKEIYRASEEICQRLKLAIKLYEIKTGNEFPKKINIDKRLSVYLENSKCDICGALNHGYEDSCWKCGSIIN